MNESVSAVSLPPSISNVFCASCSEPLFPMGDTYFSCEHRMHITCCMDYIRSSQQETCPACEEAQGRELPHGARGAEEGAFSDCFFCHRLIQPLASHPPFGKKQIVWMQNQNFYHFSCFMAEKISFREVKGVFSLVDMLLFILDPDPEREEMRSLQRGFNVKTIEMVYQQGVKRKEREAVVSLVQRISVFILGLFLGFSGVLLYRP